MKWAPKATNSKATSGYDYPFKSISILSWIKFRMAENQRRGHLTSLSIQNWGQSIVLFFFAQTIQNIQQSLEHLPFNLFCKYNLQWERRKDFEAKNKKSKNPNRHNKNRINFSSFLRFICYYFFVLVLIPSS